MQHLCNLVRDCRLADIGRNVAVIRLSRLAADRLRPHHLRLARAALEPLAHADRARLFELPSRDLVVIWRGAADVARQTARTAIVLLFADDESFPIAPERLWEDYILPQDTDLLLSLARGPEEQQAATHVAPATIPLDPASLAAFETQLTHADMARFVRRHPVGRLEPGEVFELAWENRCLDIGEIAACLSPHHDLLAEPWLFRRLTRTLDRRMLALLAAQGELSEAKPFSVRLNIASLLGPEFLRFDTNLPNALRGKVSIDLAPEDILADPSAFLFARDFVRTRGYRLILTGLATALMPMLPARRLGVDLVHLPWSAELAATGLTTLQLDAPRVVLSGANNDAAIRWGIKQGIFLYTGRMVTEALRVKPALERTSMVLG
jgi:hypothetical protein